MLSKYRTELMGIACLSVILGHFTDLNTHQINYNTNLFFRFIQIGNVGVDIFLLLSGIGLYYSYNRSKEKYYLKRCTRILIPYLLICVPYYIWKDLFLDEGIFWMDVTQLSFFTEGMITTWYVPAILILYFLYPAFYKLLYKNYKGMTIGSVLTIACGIWGGCCLGIKMLVPQFYANIEIFLTRIIVFMIGCYLGKVVKDSNQLKQSSIFISALYFVTYIFVFRYQVKLPAFWTRMCYIGLAVCICILGVLLLTIVNKPHYPILDFLGNRSIELYLCHVLIRKIYYFYFIGFSDNYHVLDYIVIVTISVILSIPFHGLNKYLYKIIVK